MRVNDNTVLITGGASGIGLELARALLRRGNEVIVCGRRAGRLDAARADNPGLHARVADVADPDSRAALVAWLRTDFPTLNVLVNNAGVQRLFEFREGLARLPEVDRELAINLAAPIHLTAMVLPILLEQPEAAIVNVSSGLAFAPLAQMPVYCASKAALHSLTMSLRHQLRDTQVRVFEAIPPLVASELGAEHRPPEANRTAMPAATAAAAIVAALENDVFEVAIGEAERLRDKREALFPFMNRA